MWSKPIESNSHRIFFALWPTNDVRNNIVSTFKQSAYSKLAWRMLPESNLHLTLHFIGNVSTEKMICLHNQAQQVTADAFDITLNHYGYFQKPKIIWMGLDKISNKLNALHTKLANNLKPCGYNAEQREFNPHLSLIRKARQPEQLLKFEPIQWQVKEFVLVESISTKVGVKYKVIQSYPLNLQA